MENTKMKKHVTVVGVIQIVFGVLGIIGAIAVHIVFNFADNFVENDEVATLVLGGMKTILPILIGFVSIVKVIGGILLLNYTNWARYLVIVIAALGCLNIPFGTLIGVYSLWVLLQDETVTLFSATKIEDVYNN